MNGNRIDDTDLLLREREARSLTLFLVLILIGFSATAIHATRQLVVLPEASKAGAMVTSYFSLSLVIAAVLLYLVHRRLWVGAIGYIVAFFAATFSTVAGLVMWKGLMAAAPALILTKLPIASAGMSALAGMALTLRPIYVVIVGVGSALSLIGFFELAAHEPGAVFSQGGGVTYFTPAISSDHLIMELLFLFGATATTAIAAQFARQTIREAVTLQRTTNQLSRYFSPEIAQGIRQGSEGFLQPGGREQEVVVLFSDLSGFTRLCAGMPAAEALAMLSEYHARMVDEIFRAGGTLDKFIGDGIMATFGTPTPVSDAADRAVRAARGMMTALASLNEDRARRGLPPLVQRIGIHAGPAVVGNVGTPQRLEFTVIGDTVNVASRIEAACKKTGQSAMISAAVFSRLKEKIESKPLGPVALDGQPAPVELHALAA